MNSRYRAHLFFVIAFLFYAAGAFAEDNIPEATEPDSFPLSVTDGLVSGNVNGVCIISGVWSDTEVDLIMPGPEPLLLKRYYRSTLAYLPWEQWIHRDYSISPSWETNLNSAFGEGIILEPNGARTNYATRTQDFKTKDFNPVIPINLSKNGKGLTNCGRGEISGRTNPKNTVLYKFHDNTKHRFDFTTLGSGDKYYFHLQRLIKWERASGNQILYEYNKDRKVAKISTANRAGDIFSSLKLHHKDEKGFWKTNRLDMTASDGRTVSYQYQFLERFCYYECHTSHLYLKEVQRPNAPTVSYEYFQNPINDDEARVSRKNYPNGRFIGLSYFNSLHDRINSTDPSFMRVKELYAPVGTDCNSVRTHRFVYHVKPNKNPYIDEKNPGSTEVYDAEDHKSHYFYDYNQRLTHVQKFLGKGNYQLYSTDRFYWGQGSNEINLLCRTLEDGSGKIQCARAFLYDLNGNVLSDRFYGNLTGQNTSEITMGSDGYPIANGVECYAVDKTYSNDGFNLLLSECDGRTKTHYGYFPDTNLMRMKLHFEGDKIRIREFYEYDRTNAILIRTIRDNGCSIDKDDLTGVTERHITLIEPKRTAPCIGLPEIVEHRYVDLDTGEEKLIKCLVNSYTTEGWLSTQDVYDGNRNLCYSLYWKHDRFGNVIEQNDPLGYVTVRKFDSNSNLTFEQGPRGDIKEFEYDYSNRLITEKEIDIDGTALKTIHSYDHLNNRVKTCDPYDQETFFAYDDLNRLISTERKGIVDENGKLSTAVIDRTLNVLGQAVETTDPLGYKQKITYNIRGKPTRIDYADGTSETFVYSLDGLIKSKTSKNGTVTRYAYDYLKRPLQEEVFAADGSFLKSTSHTYDAFHLLSTTDPEGVTTYFTYDHAERLTSEATGDRVIRYEYDNLNRKHKIIKEHTVHIFEYDLKNQLVEERLEDHQQTVFSKNEFGYDAAGNRTLIIQGPAITKIEYNCRHQPIKMTDALGNSTRITYDHDYRNALGQKVLQTQTTDPLGTITVKTYDTQGRVASLEKYNPLTLLIAKHELFHDKNGRQVRTLDSVMISGEVIREITTTWEYNRVGELLHLTEAVGTPEHRHTRHSYNVYGQKESTLKPDGITLHHEYDDLGRVSHFYSSDNSIDYYYSYDRNSRPIAVEDRVLNQTVERNYDIYGHLIQEKLANGLCLEAQYDLHGRMTQFTLPDKSIVAYDYEGAHLREVHYQGLTHSYQDYDDRGNVLKASMIRNAGDIDYAYDVLKRPVGISSPFFEEKNITYDPVGNLLGYQIDQTTSRFTYDDLYQLKHEEGIDTHEYTCDSLSNRCDKDGITHAHNSLNELLSQGDSQYTYDLNGNLIRAQKGDAVTEYSYDALNRLVMVANDDIQIRYTYDSFNRRLTKKLDTYSSLTWMDYFSDNKSWHTQEVCYFIYQGDLEIGSYVNDKLRDLRILGIGKGAEIGAAIAIYLQGSWFAPVHDHRGNVSALIESETGTLHESYRYNAFGEEWISNDWGYQVPSSLNPWRFASKRKDPHTHWIAFGRRDYDPSLGRWVTPDPQGFGDGPNLYAYVHNRPLASIDLWGLAGVSVESSSRDSVQPGAHGYRDSDQSDYKHDLNEDKRDWKSQIADTLRDAIDKVLCPLGGQIAGIASRWLRDKAFSWDEPREPSRIFTVGSQWVAPNERIIYTNGINTSYKDAVKQAQMISDAMGGQYVTGVYNSTCSIHGDIIEAGLAKCGVETLPIGLARQAILKAISEVGDLPDGRVTVIGFSEGAVINRAALRDVSYEYRDQVHPLTLGGATMIPKKEFTHAENFVASRDLVSKTAAFFEISAGLNRGDVNITPTGENILHVHAFLGRAYQNKLITSVYEPFFARNALPQ